MGFGLDLVDQPSSFSAVTPLLCYVISYVTRKIVSKMTYNVSNGTLNPAIPTIVAHFRLLDKELKYMHAFL